MDETKIEELLRLTKENNEMLKILLEKKENYLAQGLVNVIANEISNRRG